MSKIIKEEKRSVITDYGEIKYTLYYKDVKNLNIKFKIDKGVLVTIPKNQIILRQKILYKKIIILMMAMQVFLRVFPINRVEYGINAKNY